MPADATGNRKRGRRTLYVPKSKKARHQEIPQVSQSTVLREEGNKFFKVAVAGNELQPLEIIAGLEASISKYEEVRVRPRLRWWCM